MTALPSRPPTVRKSALSGTLCSSTKETAYRKPTIPAAIAQPPAKRSNELDIAATSLFANRYVPRRRADHALCVPTSVRYSGVPRPCRPPPALVHSERRGSSPLALLGTATRCLASASPPVTGRLGPVADGSSAYQPRS